MLDKNVNVDDNSQYFATPIYQNHSATAPSAQVFLLYDTLKYKQHIKTDMTHHKLPPFGK